MTVTKGELKDIKSLTTKKGRREKKMFLAEGVRVLEEAIRHKCLPRTLCFCMSMLSDRGEKLLERFRGPEIKRLAMSTREIDAIGDARTSQGIIGIFDTPAPEMAEHYRPHYRRVLMCEDIADPGNLGPILRSAAAFGIDLILLLGQCAEPYAPKVVRGSAGAVFAVPVAPIAREELAPFLKSERFALMAADVHGRTSAEILTGRVLKNRLVLAVGSEATGLSETTLKLADYRLRLGHDRKVESLNVAVAASIFLYQVYHKDRGRF